MVPVTDIAVDRAMTDESADIFFMFIPEVCIYFYVKLTIFYRGKLYFKLTFILIRKNNLFQDIHLKKWI